MDRKISPRFPLSSCPGDSICASSAVSSASSGLRGISRTMPDCRSPARNRANGCSRPVSSARTVPSTGFPLPRKRSTERSATQMNPDRTIACRRDRAKSACGSSRTLRSAIRRDEAVPSLPKGDSLLHSSPPRVPETARGFLVSAVPVPRVCGVPGLSSRREPHPNAATPPPAHKQLAPVRRSTGCVRPRALGERTTDVVRPRAGSCRYPVHRKLQPRADHAPLPIPKRMPAVATRLCGQPTVASRYLRHRLRYTAHRRSGCRFASGFRRRFKNSFKQRQR